MSYSLNIREKTKAAAKSAVAYQFDKMVIGEWNQPMHAYDRMAVVDVAEHFINLLPELQEGEEVTVSLSGSLGWQHEEPAFNTDSGSCRLPFPRFTSGGVSCHVSILKPMPAPAA